MLQTWISALGLFLPIGYFCAAFVYGKYMWRESKWAKRWKLPVLGTVLCLHLIELLLRGIHYHGYPITSLPEAASVIALAMGLVYVGLEVTYKIGATGYFVSVCLFFLQLFSTCFSELKDSVPEELRIPLFFFHTSFGILGYATFFLSSLFSLLYLFLYYDLKGSHFGIFFRRLPPLQLLDRVHIKMAQVGGFFLTLAIILGILLGYQLGINPFLDWKFWISVALLGVYVMEICGAKWWGWSGKKVAYCSLSGLGLLLFSLLIVNLFLSSFHYFR